MAEKTGEEKSIIGFTILELLVVIAIIALIASIAVASLNSARQKARDARRVGDLSELRKAIELYVTAIGHLPGSSGPGNCNGNNGCNSTQAQPWIPGLTDEYISQVSVDPINSATLRYRYRSSDGDEYELDAPAETDYHFAENDGGNRNTCPSSANCRYEIGTDLTKLRDGP
ncbi:MAG: prepilin-type N-terminal cleavage/methylation domain-containing protein [bacterium]|nr:prepilin-type N-terminal cleavage/methylation domain-containing protein [bacterium]